MQEQRIECIIEGCEKPRVIYYTTPLTSEFQSSYCREHNELLFGRKEVTEKLKWGIEMFINPHSLINLWFKRLN